MFAREQLRQTLARINGRPYPAYRDLGGGYDCGEYRLHVDHVQADPFAAPSRLRVVVPAAGSGLVPGDWRDGTRRIAVEDWLLRRLAAALGRAVDGAGEQGPAPAALLHVLPPGQEVLERSAVAVRAGTVEFRLTCELPAERRSVLGPRAAAALDTALPAAILAALPHAAADRASLEAHIGLVEDQEALRALLPQRGWVAFLADGSILPRRSGDSDLPLPPRAAVRLLAPEGLAATVELPHRGVVRGLPIPRGVTLVVGGAYHGKSTLLRAVERGVYNHVVGDGRELCVTDRAAVSVAAEDGRAVTGLDISPFVRTLPGGRETRAFRTLAASGSTSQAAALCEALEAGATCLLLDEDRSAANFMSRDARMRALVPDAEDPVVPFVERVRQLHQGRGVSTLLVLGGAGTFLDVADLVIRMRDYQPVDVTVEAVAVAARLPVGPANPAAPPEAAPPRVLGPEPFAAVADAGRLRARPRGRQGLTLGEVQVQLGGLGQLVDEAQVRALADMLPLAAAYADGVRTLAEICAEVERDIDRLGLQALSPWPGQCPGDYARPRAMELAAVLSRIPGLRLAGDPESGPSAPRRTLRRPAPDARRVPAPRERWRPTTGAGPWRDPAAEEGRDSVAAPAARQGAPRIARGPAAGGRGGAATPAARQGNPRIGRGPAAGGRWVPGTPAGRQGNPRSEGRAERAQQRGPGGPPDSGRAAPPRAQPGPERNPSAGARPGRAARLKPVYGTLAGFSGPTRRPEARGARGPADQERTARRSPDSPPPGDSGGS